MARYTVLHAGAFRFRSHMTSSHTKITQFTFCIHRSFNTHSLLSPVPPGFIRIAGLINEICSTGRLLGVVSGFDLVLVFCSCCVLVCVLSTVIRHHHAPLVHSVIVSVIGIVCHRLRARAHAPGTCSVDLVFRFLILSFSDNYVDGLYRNL